MTEMKAWEKLLLDKFERLASDVSNVFNYIKELKDSSIRMDKTLVRNTEQLATHIQRTDLAEKRMEVLEARLEREVHSLEDKIDEIHDIMIAHRDEIKNDVIELNKTIVGWKANISLAGWIVALVVSLVSIGARFL